ncbi:GyrI-like domain-containing protein [Psychrobacillus vulpis]|uniref:GyrI-like domain-containing protein n=1 Tax=Psychrobacillus vulpis TaxID=2325572 RepID=A0A544TPR0_9BACI|nr:GyrI-like domain-containing protein [Psychrobacillus vulpis]TQR19440.1 GyrI-like domain-containing protein [Psychrobacillus vulpis]
MKEMTMENKTIKELHELRLVGFRVLCAGEQYIEEIPKASLRLSECISEIKHVVNPLQQFGAFVVDNDTVEEDGYWVCVEVKEFEDIPTNMVTLTVPPQRYAITRHLGPNYQISKEYNELHKWIEKNNHIRLKNKWHLEKFYSWEDKEEIDVELFDTIK